MPAGGSVVHRRVDTDAIVLLRLLAPPTDHNLITPQAEHIHAVEGMRGDQRIVEQLPASETSLGVAGVGRHHRPVFRFDCTDERGRRGASFVDLPDAGVQRAVDAPHGFRHAGQWFHAGGFPPVAGGVPHQLDAFDAREENPLGSAGRIGRNGEAVHVPHRVHEQAATQRFLGVEGEFIRINLHLLVHRQVFDPKMILTAEVWYRDENMGAVHIARPLDSMLLRLAGNFYRSPRLGRIRGAL